VVNKIRGTLQCAAVKAAGLATGERPCWRYRHPDRGKVISEDIGVKLENIALNDLGTAKTINIDKDNTPLLDGEGAQGSGRQG